jgi:FixJ family two-component response regulator
MPGETGLALAEFVRTAEPNIPVILVTGAGDVTLARGPLDVARSRCSASR